MLTFAADFAAEIASRGTTPFWSAILHLPAPKGDVGICQGVGTGSPVTISGLAHDVALIGLGEIGALATRSEPRDQLDVTQTDLAYVNMLSLSTGERMSDVLAIPDLDSVLVDVYLTVMKADSTFTRALLFGGVIQGPRPRGYEVGSFRAASLIEKYFNAPALRTITEAEFPFARTSDLGAGVPIVLGSVSRAPGRVLKAYGASPPQPGADNVGGASLSNQITVAASAPAETWTITALAPETQAYAGAGDTDDLLGDTTTPRVAYAQSWTPTASQQLAGFTVRLKRLAETPPVPTGPTAVLYLYSDNAGQPGTMLGHASVTQLSLDYIDETFLFPSAVNVTGGTTYWIVVRAWQAFTGSKFYWRSSSTGGYAGGNGKVGTFPSSEETLTPPTFTWNASRDAYDYVFAAILLGNAYSFAGSVTGADGTGNIGSNSVSTSGRITIPAAAWRGSPAAGDTFTFDIDPAAAAASRIVFSESPAQTPCGTPGSFYWEDSPLDTTGGTLVSITTASIDETIGTGSAVIGQTFKFTTAKLLKKLTLKLKKVGSPPSGSTVEVSIVKANAAGTAPLEDGGATLFSYSIPLSALTTSYQDIEVNLSSTPVLLAANTSYAVVCQNPQGGSSGNEIMSGSDTTNPYASGNRFVKNSTTPTWVANATKDLCCTITVATLTQAASADDGSGNLTCLATLDVQIPDGISISQDVVGIRDDTLGTYTGSASSAITRPADVVHWLARRAGVPTASIDLADTFAQTRASHGSIYQFDGVIQDAQTYKQLLIRLGFESRSMIDWVGAQLELKYQVSGTQTVDATVALADIPLDGQGVPQIVMDNVPMEEIVTAIELRYGRKARLSGSEAYADLVSGSNGTTLGRFGKLVRDDYFLFDFVATEAMASDLLSYCLARFSDPAKRRARFTTTLKHLAIEKDDVVAINLLNQGGAYWRETIQNSPVTYWRLNDSSGTTAEDLMAAANGTYTGGFTLAAAPLIVGTTNKAASFNGTSGYISAASVPALGAAISLEAWIQPSALASARTIIAGPGATSIVLNADGSLTFNFTDAGVVARAITSAAGLVVSGTRYRVCATHDGTTARLYLGTGSNPSDSQIASGAYSLQSVASGTWYLGAASGGGSQFFAGSLDDVALYGSALSAARSLQKWRAGALAQFTGGYTVGFPIDLTEADNLDDALDGLVGDQAFVVEAKSILPSEMLCRFVAREL